MKPRRCLLWAFVALALLPEGASAWWSEGHHCINRAAVLALPEDMPEFFRGGADVLCSHSMDPDLWKDRKLPALRSAEYPNHHLDLEFLGGREPPRARAGFLALCERLELDPDEVGMLPYAIQKWHDRLVLAFAEHRRWPESAAVKAKVLYIAGVLSHYTADASQPLHCTIHWDGHAKEDGSSPRTGIHLKMDALPGQLAIKPEELAEGLQIEAVDDIFGGTLAVIRESNGRVEHVYKLEEKLPPPEGRLDEPVDDDVRALATLCCRAGTRLTATLWYSAWIASEGVELPDWHEAAKKTYLPDGAVLCGHATARLAHEMPLNATGARPTDVHQGW